MKEIPYSSFKRKKGWALKTIILPKGMNEHQIQAAFFHWADLNRKNHPALQFLFAIPNGGARHIAVARKLKAEGVKAGVPDVFLPFPVHPFAGLFIEFKSAKGTLTDGQRVWLDALAEYGYQTAVCRDLPSGIKAVSEYLGVLGVLSHGI